MRTALVTTTINVPHVLKLYRALGPGVPFFVVGDEKTPPGTAEFCKTLADTEYYSPARQKELGYECSVHIGWDCIQRRNIGFLEALKWGADVIVSIDDDNIPLGPYFDHIDSAFSGSFSGIAAHGYKDWFDPGSLLVPPSRHRGFPHDTPTLYRLTAVTGAAVGVVAGACMGDPDIAATTRMERAAAPVDVHGTSVLLQSGIVVDPATRTVFNSQNTAFLRELAPAMFMLPGLGRYDDIFASLITQTVMREKGLHVHLGQPSVWQQRNAHNLLHDLRDETLGMTHFKQFAQHLDRNPLDGKPLLDWLHAQYNVLTYNCAWWPAEASRAGHAWCRDIEKVL